MKLRVIAPIVYIFMSLSCDKGSEPGPVCSVGNPTEDLEWLKAKIATMASPDLSEYFYVSQGKYGTTTVFIFLNCCPHCNTIVPVYNCAGEHLGNIGNGEGDVDSRFLTHESVIWKPADFACNVQ